MILHSIPVGFCKNSASSPKELSINERGKWKEVNSTKGISKCSPFSGT